MHGQSVETVIGIHDGNPIATTLERQLRQRKNRALYLLAGLIVSYASYRAWPRLRATTILIPVMISPYMTRPQCWLGCKLRQAL